MTDFIFIVYSIKKIFYIGSFEWLFCLYKLQKYFIYRRIYMTEQTINELTNFFQQFKQGETKQATQSNLTFDDAVKYFFRNMEERGTNHEFL